MYYELERWFEKVDLSNLYHFPLSQDGSFTYLRIDGQSKEKSRQRNVDDFNDRESGIDCMLLSTKAAGVGLTLNGANRG